jgi:hypothetical protein
LLHPVNPDTGFRVGGSFGAGLHLFITDWLAINPEVHDIVVGHNDAGLNATITDVPPVVQNGERICRGSPGISFNLGFAFCRPRPAHSLEQKLRGRSKATPQQPVEASPPTSTRHHRTASDTPRKPAPPPPPTRTRRRRRRDVLDGAPGLSHEEPP